GLLEHRVNGRDAKRECYCLRLRLPYTRMPARPKPRRRSVEGAGTVPVNENAALNGPWLVTSVPIRSQSGASVPGPSFRIQLCRSGANGVPGDTIGFGADSQRKLPA